jgi:hypothetical protein
MKRNLTNVMRYWMDELEWVLQRIDFARRKHLWMPAVAVGCAWKNSYSLIPTLPAATFTLSRLSLRRLSMFKKMSKFSIW